MSTPNPTNVLTLCAITCSGMLHSICTTNRKGFAHFIYMRTFLTVKPAIKNICSARNFVEL